MVRLCQYYLGSMLLHVSQWTYNLPLVCFCPQGVLVLIPPIASAAIQAMRQPFSKNCSVIDRDPGTPWGHEQTRGRYCVNCMSLSRVHGMWVVSGSAAKGVISEHTPPGHAPPAWPRVLAPRPVLPRHASFVGSFCSVFRSTVPYNFLCILVGIPSLGSGDIAGSAVHHVVNAQPICICLGPVNGELVVFHRPTSIAFRVRILYRYQRSEATTRDTPTHYTYAYDSG